MTNLVKIAITVSMLFVLTACGGGGGGSPAPVPAVSLTGTITDTTQVAVTGVALSVTNAATGASVATTSSDAVGRYSLRGLPAGTPLRVAADAGRGYFQLSAVVTLSGDTASLLDVALPSTRDKATKTVQFGTIANSAIGGAVTSATFVGAAETASLTVPAGSLRDASAGVYSGAASIYLAPIEIGKMGTGFAPYQVALPAAAGDKFPADFPNEILELYASAAVDMVAADGRDLSSDGSTTLIMPVPVSPAYLRVAAAAAVAPVLWRFDAASTAWVEMGATPTFDGANNWFSAAISMSGIYAVGTTSPATSISGSLLFSDSSPAAGVAVYVTGGDAAYQQLTYSDSAGNFSALVKDASQARLDFVSWGYGLQLSGSNHSSVDLSTDTATLGSVTLEYAKPVVDISSLAMVQLDDSDVSKPVTTGIIFSSGRIFVATSSGGETDTLATAEIADVVLVAEINDISVGGIRTLNLAVGHSGTAGSSQIRLAGATAYGVKVRLDDLDLTTPAVIEVLTADGHQGTLTVKAIDGVSQGLGFWTLTLSSSFNL